MVDPIKGCAEINLHYPSLLPTHQCTLQCMGDPLLCVSHTLLSALESWQEARIVQIDFGGAVVRVKHQGILYKLCSVGIGGSVYIDIVSIKPITARYGGRLSEKTG